MKKTREEKIDFCVWAESELEGVSEKYISREVYEKMSDEELEKECKCLDSWLIK